MQTNIRTAGRLRSSTCDCSIALASWRGRNRDSQRNESRHCKDDFELKFGDSSAEVQATQKDLVLLFVLGSRVQLSELKILSTVERSFSGQYKDITQKIAILDCSEAHHTFQRPDTFGPIVSDLSRQTLA